MKELVRFFTRDSAWFLEVTPANKGINPDDTLIGILLFDLKSNA
jgi:hypothetical protein